MRVQTRIVFVDDNNEKFFGEGPYKLLTGIEKTGSLRASANDMWLSYTKALKIINKAEQSLGIKLIKRTVGGKSGGGSTLTDEGRAWLKKYEEFRNDCIRENEKLFTKYYGKN